MLKIHTGMPPNSALLNHYTESGAYTDCFSTIICGHYSHADYVTAFYTTWLFKLERVILHWALKKPSSDETARQVARGDIDSFAAWHVEAREKNKLLMCDFQKRTRSWFMLETVVINKQNCTRLYFGSAVIPYSRTKTGKARLGLAFSMLIGFHKLYSILLLALAKSRLAATPS